MRKISFVLAAIMAIALNCNAQSSNGCYRGFIDAGYSIGVGDYEFGRFEVNTSHGYQFNPYLAQEQVCTSCLLTRQRIWIFLSM